MCVVCVIVCVCVVCVTVCVWCVHICVQSVYKTLYLPVALLVSISISVCLSLFHTEWMRLLQGPVTRTQRSIQAAAPLVCMCHTVNGGPACEPIPHLMPLPLPSHCSCVELQQLNAQHQQIQQMCEHAEQEIFKELCLKVHSVKGGHTV